ncbi:hypothetical protein ACFSOZ_10255 [Mesorhizobium newzealandense]|uniref:Uncharacterized protein n=1 Tax=Mesorhizobium newzealandense TaxID=1300302 RepID=A0ABW4UBN7_9HYPH
MSFGDRSSWAIFAAWKIVIKTKIDSPSVGLMVRTTRPRSSLMAQDQSLTAITSFPTICPTVSPFDTLAHGDADRQPVTGIDLPRQA